MLSWSKSNNATHGIIEATVDIENGLVPFDVRVYYAKTIDNKRFKLKILKTLIHIFVNVFKFKEKTLDWQLQAQKTPHNQSYIQVIFF